MAEKIEHWLALNMIPGVGASRCQKLLKHFGSPQAILGADLKELQHVSGIGEYTARQIVKFRDELDIQIEKEISKIEKQKVSIVTFSDDNYPSNLKSIFDPPIVLYVKGKLLPEDRIAIAMVGTRRPTAYGKMVAEKLSKELAEREVSVVSGLARGIDTSAHKGALSCGGRTIAVLGCGIDICYPRENRAIFDEIVKSGAVVSEFPMGTPPERINFPLRNRIISGLSLGAVIVEAGSRSGALITADCALEQGREVFAVPGNIFNLGTKGTHSLIKQGAKLVERCEDIIEEIRCLRDVLPVCPAIRSVGEVKLSQEEERVYNLLSFEPIHIDLISKDSGLPINKISSVLMNLEMKGKIRQVAGKMFLRVPETQ
ncbi:DNA-processing protein DprA [bacterium]|nr:DNA-processing protein DprA [bacterium]